MALIWVCAACLGDVEAQNAQCPACGNEHSAQATKAGQLTLIPLSAGFRCAGCDEPGHELKLRMYRRVVGLGIIDRVHTALGYFCAGCRRRLFVRYMGLTLLLGWGGVLALFLRNPFAIGTNCWALVRPPLGRNPLGGLPIDALRVPAA